MRLWSLHPKYLDPKGLVALWREALLAQKVLSGKTQGYRHHPQLERFKACKDPKQAIAAYLDFVWQEAKRRGYDFDPDKVGKKRMHGKIGVTQGQIQYEFFWLGSKLKSRNPKEYDRIRSIRRIQSHPLFYLKRGTIESWERVGPVQ